MKRKQRFWAGFSENKIDFTSEYYGDSLPIAAIYKNKGDAKKCYKDVREVRIVEIKH